MQKIWLQVVKYDQSYTGLFKLLIQTYGLVVKVVYIFNAYAPDYMAALKENKTCLHLVTC